MFCNSFPKKTWNIEDKRKRKRQPREIQEELLSGIMFILESSKILIGSQGFWT